MDIHDDGLPNATFREKEQGQGEHFTDHEEIEGSWPTCPPHRRQQLRSRTLGRPPCEVDGSPLLFCFAFVLLVGSFVFLDDICLQVTNVTKGRIV